MLVRGGDELLFANGTDACGCESCIKPLTALHFYTDLVKINYII